MTVYCGIIGTHTMSIGVTVCLSWESGIMERVISFGSAVLGLILLTLGAVQGGRRRLLRLGRFRAWTALRAAVARRPERLRMTLVGIGYEEHVRVERS